jgi:Na+-translocating ferredoxin:NAD+ oxidoreductase RnfG subunit
MHPIGAAERDPATAAEGIRMVDWVRLTAPAAVFASIVSPAHSVQYLTLTQSQKLSFPSATDFVPIDSQAWKVASDGKDVGRYIVDRVIGKHLYIDYAVTLDAGGRVQRVDILQYREAYGGEVRDRSWLNQFVGKSSASPLQVDVDIRNISGATLSCHHVTEGVKRIVSRYGKNVR